MKAEDIHKKINANIYEGMMIKEVIFHDASHKLIGISLVFEDPVQTTIRFTAGEGGELRVELSQLENVPTRKTYFDSSVPF